MNRFTKNALISCAFAGLAFPAIASPAGGVAHAGASATPAPAPQGQAISPGLIIVPRPEPMQRYWPILHDDPTELGQDYQTALRVVRCVQKYHPKQLARLLRTKISSPAEARAANDLLFMSGGCGDPDLQISIRMLRGAAAEAMLDNFATADPNQAKVVSVERAKGLDASMPGVDRARDKFSQEIEQLVECQVVLAPGLARKLISAKPGSQDEDRSREAIVSASPACGSVEAASPSSQLVYRIYLAEALYHWTMVGPPAQYG